MPFYFLDIMLENIQKLDARLRFIMAQKRDN